MKRIDTNRCGSTSRDATSARCRFSREKGKRGERELADELEKTLGVKARRGQQFQGSPDSPDVVTDIPEIHIECKRAERFRLYESLDQAVNDAGKQKIPLVFHRQNQQPWVVVLRYAVK